MDLDKLSSRLDKVLAITAMVFFIVAATVLSIATVVGGVVGLIALLKGGL